MREDSSGRNTVPPWGQPHDAVDTQPALEAPSYAVGNRICNSYTPPSFGTVVAVDAAEATMGVKWDDGNSPITYPMDATYLRRAMPWE